MTAGAPAPLRFVNAAPNSGLDFRLDNGATAEKYQIETLAGGVGVIDFNNDGLPDIYFTNGAKMPAMEKDHPRFFNRLFQNLGNGKFKDVTIQASVQGSGFCTGVAVGDYDGDGFQDIFLCCRPNNILYRNRGDGKFIEVTGKAGLEGQFSGGQKLWSIAAGWLDYDNDGRLDLFVANYCDWSPTKNPACLDRRGIRFYCDPRRFKGLPNSLFRNNGDGTFTDVSEKTGIASVSGYGMGVAFADYNGDGFPDIFVANDTVRNQFFENDGHGKFTEKALRKGVAYREDGLAISGMGVDFRDFDNDGLPDLFVTALSSETWPLYRNLEGGGFEDITLASGVGQHASRMSGWSNGIFDFDNDGLKDLYAARSHVLDNVDVVMRKPYREPNALFLNLGDKQFRNASAEVGADFARADVRRGSAFADFNGDGTVDIVTSVIGGPAELLVNEPSQRSNWILLRLVGKVSNRDGIGAAIKIVDASGLTQHNHVTTSVGYASASDSGVHFGLGTAKKIKLIEIRWPTGRIQALRDVAVNQVLKVTEAN